MRALVTGGGGFLGGAIVRQLLDRGVQVRSFSRGAYPHLDALGVETVRGDIADADAVSRAVLGCDVVFHVAARAGASGPWEAFFKANVLGTQHIVDACKRHHVGALIYTSSPSVVFNDRDMEGVDESVPYPDRYQAHYPATKAEAERLVLESDGPYLATLALRPHLIWGPGDTNLLPRIVQRAHAGKLRRIAAPAKQVDTVFIDDAARAHLCAMDAILAGGERAAEARGRAYFISAGEPIETWAMINRLLSAADMPPIKRAVPRWAALAVGAVCETAWPLLGRDDEPPMTRWVAHELTTAHWFDISAARDRLGFTPQVSIDEGLDRLRAWFRDNPAREVYLS